MYNIKTLNNIAAVGLETFSDKYAIDAENVAPDAILVRSAKMHDYAFNPELLCIARAGAGTNNIPVDVCAEQGIVVFNTPGANANSVKELAIATFIMASRDLVGGIEWVKSIAPEGGVAAKVEKGKSAFVGPEILGKKLGVIGLGAVGAIIANAALELGMKVYGYDPFLSVDAAWRLSTNVIHATDMDTIFKECDYITIHVPYNDSTKNTICAETIAKMKDGVRIINLARGELVNDDDVMAALESGKVARYVTDFPNDKIITGKNVIAIPHLGASTPESEENCAVMAANEIMDYVEHGNIINSVNMPRVALPMSGNPRICIIHKNIPEMIAKISGAVSAEKINIENMVNAGKKSMAYTILDVSDAPDSLIEDVMAIEGVIRVRIIK